MKAVLFDLDGTLLDLDVDRFMGHYIEALSQEFAPLVPPMRFQPALMAATTAMITNDGSMTNEERFWRVFQEKTGVGREALLPVTERFYRDVYPRLAFVARPVAIAPQLVSEVKAAGMIVVLATNAIFPKVAILERMRWGELDPNLFDLITCYETMHAAKPNPLFYREILERLGVAPCDAVMVGNDPELDVRAAKEAGLSAYLVDDVTPASQIERKFSANTSLTSSPKPLGPDGQGPLAGVLSFIGKGASRSGA